MATKTRLHLILLLAVALTLRVAVTHRNMRLVSGYTLETVPAQLSSQTGVNLPLTPFEVALLSPDGGRIIQRSYGHGDTILWLAAVQSRSDWRVQHPPQICYTAQGWRIEAQAARTLHDKQMRAYGVQRMIVSKNGARREIYYFYTDGRHWTASYFSRVLHAFWDRAAHADANTWVLIQVSTPLSSGDADARLQSACLELFAAAPVIPCD